MKDNDYKLRKESALFSWLYFGSLAGLVLKKGRWEKERGEKKKKNIVAEGVTIWEECLFVSLAFFGFAYT